VARCQNRGRRDALGGWAPCPWPEKFLCFTAPHFPPHAPTAGIAKYRDTYGKGWNAIAEARHSRLQKLGVINRNHALPAMEREVGPPYAFPKDIAKLGPDQVNCPVPWSELTGGQREFQAAKMAIHAAMVDRMDQEICRMIAQLKAMGAVENTLILFASDNGASAEMMVRGDGHDRSAPPIRRWSPPPQRRKRGRKSRSSAGASGGCGSSACRRASRPPRQNFT
jgi:arylsulfatase A-like enzyme